jgi:hypothetical protein
MKCLTERQISKLPNKEKLRIFVERLNKMDALIKHYKVKTPDLFVAYAAVAFHLACDFVPGFKVAAPKKAIRRRKK